MELTWEGLYNKMGIYYPQFTNEQKGNYISEFLIYPVGDPHRTGFDGIVSAYNMWDLDDDLVLPDGTFNPAAKRRYNPESWEDEIFKNGDREEISLKISGGDSKTNLGTDYTEVTNMYYGDAEGLGRIAKEKIITCLIPGTRSSVSKRNSVFIM